METKHRILMAMPCLATVPVATMTSVLSMDKPSECVFAVTQGSLVYDARNYLYNEAVERKCDLIFWMDSDMVFPQFALTRLVEDLDALKASYVTGLYFTRKKPTIPTLSEYVKWQQDETGAVSHSIKEYLNYPKDTVFRIGGSGFGCCLTTTKMVGEVGTLFNTNPFDPLPGLGEDYSFCFKAADIGYDLFCDSTVKCGHVGETIVTEETYKEERERQTT